MESQPVTPQSRRRGVHALSYGTPASASSTLSCPGMRPATGWMPNLHDTPCSRSVLTISATAYCNGGEDKEGDLGAETGR